MLGTRTARLPDCRPLLADPDDLTLVFQPIVDLAGATIAGYEALARFPGSAGPDVWFAAAAEAGVAAELEALAVHKALATVDDLPRNTFLTVKRQPAPARVRAGAGRPGRPLRPAPRRRRADRARPRARPGRAAPADRGAAVARCAHRAGRRRERLLRAAAARRPQAPGREAGPGAGQRRRHRPRTRGAGGDARGVRRPDRRLAARRGHRDRCRAGRLRPARRPARPGLAAGLPVPGLRPALRSGDRPGPCARRAGAAHRQRREPAPPRPPVHRRRGGAWRAAGRADRAARPADRAAAQRPPDGGGPHRSRLPPGAPHDRHHRGPATRAHPCPRRPLSTPCSARIPPATSSGC
jgi:hypothetical protein